MGITPPHAPGAAGGPFEEITARIRRKGHITFDEFMEVALYWPRGGYYASPSATWGARGDYITNLDVSPVFARVLGAQIREMWSSLGSPGTFILVEAGAGRGWLINGILDYLEAECPDLYRAVRASAIETNTHLSPADPGRVSWYGSLEEFDKELDGPFTGCIFSNEFLDALPFHRVLGGGPRGLKELYVGLDGVDTLVDVVQEPSTDALGAYFDSLGMELAEGRRAEVGLRAARWIQTAAEVIESGYVMTIDYGLAASELYSPARSDTLMCHYRHTLNDDPYRRVGRQDITSHVDFTTLSRAGLKAGLETTGFTTQSYFLLGAGIEKELKEVREAGLSEYDAIRHNQGIKELIMPGSMGDTFKVLLQHKGVAAPALSGFSFKNMSALL
jgi:SAM-dependent MidA family methyltransferase